MAVEDRPALDLTKVETWRRDTLIEAGYPAEEAVVLAGRQDVDLHRAILLLERGCDVKTALRILL